MPNWASLSEAVKTGTTKEALRTSWSACGDDREKRTEWLQFFLEGVSTAQEHAAYTEIDLVLIVRSAFAAAGDAVLRVTVVPSTFIQWLKRCSTTTAATTATMTSTSSSSSINMDIKHRGVVMALVSSILKSKNFQLCAPCMEISCLNMTALSSIMQQQQQQLQQQQHGAAASADTPTLLYSQMEALIIVKQCEDVLEYVCATLPDDLKSYMSTFSNLLLPTSTVLVHSIAAVLQQDSSSSQLLIKSCKVFSMLGEICTLHIKTVCNLLDDSAEATSKEELCDGLMRVPLFLMSVVKSYSTIHDFYQNAFEHAVLMLQTISSSCPPLRARVALQLAVVLSDGAEYLGDEGQLDLVSVLGVKRAEMVVGFLGCILSGNTGSGSGSDSSTLSSEEEARVEKELVLSRVDTTLRSIQALIGHMKVAATRLSATPSTGAAQIKQALSELRTGCICSVQSVLESHPMWIVDNRTDYWTLCLNVLMTPVLLTVGYNSLKQHSEKRGGEGAETEKENPSSLSATSSSPFALFIVKLKNHLATALRNTTRYSASAAEDILNTVQSLAAQDCMHLLCEAAPDGDTDSVVVACSVWDAITDYPKPTTQQARAAAALVASSSSSSSTFSEFERHRYQLVWEVNVCNCMSQLVQLALQNAKKTTTTTSSSPSHRRYFIPLDTLADIVHYIAPQIDYILNSCGGAGDGEGIVMKKKKKNKKEAGKIENKADESDLDITSEYLLSATILLNAVCEYMLHAHYFCTSSVTSKNSGSNSNSNSINSSSNNSLLIGDYSEDVQETLGALHCDLRRLLIGTLLVNIGRQSIFDDHTSQICAEMELMSRVAVLDLMMSSGDAGPPGPPGPATATSAAGSSVSTHSTGTAVPTALLTILSLCNVGTAIAMPPLKLPLSKAHKLLLLVEDDKDEGKDEGDKETDSKSKAGSLLSESAAAASVAELVEALTVDCAAHGVQLQPKTQLPFTPSVVYETAREAIFYICEHCPGRMSMSSSTSSSAPTTSTIVTNSSMPTAAAATTDASTSALQSVYNLLPLTAAAETALDAVVLPKQLLSRLLAQCQKLLL